MLRKLTQVIPWAMALLVLLAASGVMWRTSFSPPLVMPHASEKQFLLDYNKCVNHGLAAGTPTANVFSSCGQELDKTPDAPDTRARLDEMRWMLTVIGSLAAFFAIAQAAAAYFSAVSYSKSADEAIARIEKQEAKMRERYPLFDDVEKLRKETYATLDKELKYATKSDDPDADPLEALVFVDKFYKCLDVETRQRMLAVESFVSLALNQEALSDEAYAARLVRLAVFYRSKFLYEKSLNQSSVADIERAESYLRLALSKTPSDFTILNEIGNLYLNVAKVWPEQRHDYLDRAGKELRRSRKLMPNQQRAYYGLAIIHGKYKARYDTALVYLEKALSYTNWQRLPVSFTQSWIHYNLGCYEAQRLAKGSTPISTGQGGKCIGALRTAAALHCISTEKVNDDFGEVEGDIYALLQKATPELSQQLNDVRKALLAPGKVPAQAPKSFRLKIETAWRVFFPNP